MAAAWSKDGQRLAGGGDPRVHVWNAQSDSVKPVQTFDGGLAPVESVAWSPDGKLLAIGWGTRRDFGVTVYNAERRIPSHTTELPSQPQALAFAPDNATLAIGGKDGPVQLWRIP